MMTRSIWIQIASKSFLRVVNLDVYATNDTTYSTAAITTTMSRLGPSGSLKNENSALEHTRAVMPRMSSVVFFDMEFIFGSIPASFVLALLDRRWKLYTDA